MAPAVKPKVQSKKSPKKPKKLVVEIGKEVDDDRKPGCIYLGHIPHGFYEKQMKQYFSQFGRVMDVKLCRSKKTKNSKGYGFVKFRYSAVAKTVAETCHNYLFLNKLLKCEYKPLSEVHKSVFKKGSNPVNLPKSKQNNPRTQYKVALAARASLSKAAGKMEKLKASGLSVDLSDIMNVPDVSKIDSVIAAEKQKKVTKDADTSPQEADSATPEPVSKRRKVDPSSSPTESLQQSSPLVSKSPKKSPKKINNGGTTPLATTPKLAKATSPKLAKATTPKLAKAVTPKLAKAATPKLAKATTPKLAKATSPKLAKAATPKTATKKQVSDGSKSPLVTTPKSVIKSTPKSAMKKVGDSGKATTPKSARVTTPKSASKKIDKQTPTPTPDTLSRKRKRSLK